MSLHAFTANDALRWAFAEEPLCVVDVGCAGGIDPLFSALADAGLARNFGFEANPDQFAKLPPAPSTSYLPLALSDRDGKLVFNALGTVGSVRARPDRESRFGEVFRQIEVECARIDTLRQDGRVPGVDILKLDVEGSELDVLKGAEEVLASEILCVKAEFGFHASRGSNRFSELHDKLQAVGFRLFGLAVSNSSGGGIHAGDGLWLRAPETILLSGADSGSVRSRLIRLAAIAAHLRLPDYVAIIASVGDKVLSGEQVAALRSVASQTCFVPSIVSRPFPRLGVLLFALTQLAFGRTHSTKAAPKLNRLLPLKLLFAVPRLGWMSRRHAARQATRVKGYLHSERFDRPGAVRDA